MRTCSFETGLSNDTKVFLLVDKMKNCLEYVGTKLTNFIVTFGVFNVIDVLVKFGIITDVIMLDKNFHRTEELQEMRFGAVLTQVGYSTAYNLKAQSDIIKHLVHLICNPGSPEKAININSALKCLCLKINKNADSFYELISEAMHRRMMFQKLSQIYGPLKEEVNQVNQEFLNMMINSNLISMDQELARIALYLVHNINNYQRLKQFLIIVEKCVKKLIYLMLLMLLMLFLCVK